MELIILKGTIANLIIGHLITANCSLITANC
jgi:hypothetical protein